MQENFIWKKYKYNLDLRIYYFLTLFHWPLGTEKSEHFDRLYPNYDLKTLVDPSSSYYVDELMMKIWVSIK